METVDLTHTGVEELVVADRQSGIVYQLTRDNTGFSRIEISNRPGADWRDVAVGDLEGDGDKEIFIASRGLHVVEIHFNNCCNSD